MLATAPLPVPRHSSLAANRRTAGPSAASVVALAIVLLVAACSGGDGAGEPAEPPAARDAAAATDAPVELDGAATDGASASAPDLPRCVPGPGATGKPGSVVEAVALVNSLPRPVSLPCFLQSLDRPLEGTATHSFISLQPAMGTRSPRIILFSRELVITVVPEGRGAHTVEFGQFVAENRTLKGELAFPLAGPVTVEDALRKTHHTTGGSVCRFCHAEEVSAAPLGFPEGFVSSALRPHEPTLVDLAELRAHHTTCDPALEPQRCNILSAIFDHGPVLLRDFPPTVPSLFD